MCVVGGCSLCVGVCYAVLCCAEVALLALCRVLCCWRFSVFFSVSAAQGRIVRTKQVGAVLEVKRYQQVLHVVFFTWKSRRVFVTTAAWEAAGGEVCDARGKWVR